jgi:TetR/AcrR family transcriptional repressor of lmrAB and yxaGH operons
MSRSDHSRVGLIKAAATLFRRQGYAATGVNQILQAAKAQPGSMYHHFPAGKQQLAVAVIETAAAVIAGQLRRALESDLPVGDVIEAAIDILIAGLANDERDGCPIEPVATESVNASPVVRAAAARAFADWCAAISDRLRADGWASAVADQTAMALVAQIEGALLLSRISGDTAALMGAKSAVRRLLQ